MDGFLFYYSCFKREIVAGIWVIYLLMPPCGLSTPNGFVLDISRFQQTINHFLVSSVLAGLGHSFAKILI